MIILNEKEYVLDILQNENADIPKIHSFLGLYARYLFHEKKLQKEDLAKELNQFMQSRCPAYRPADWSASIEKYAAGTDKYPLCECDGIWITESELKTIAKIDNKVLERLAFTLLCLAKFRNFRNPDNDGWINYSNGEIYKMACINTTALEKDLKLNQLRKLGLIEFAKKVSNLSIRVLFLNNKEDEGKLFVSDFRKLGYEWKVYNGEKYIRCAGCGILAKNTNGKRRYCKDCADINKKKLDRTRMQYFRKVEFAQKEKTLETP